MGSSPILTPLLYLVLPALNLCHIILKVGPSPLGTNCIGLGFRFGQGGFGPVLDNYFSALGYTGYMFFPLTEALDEEQLLSSCYMLENTTSNANAVMTRCYE